MLLIHGAGGQHVHWPPQVRRLPGVRTIAPDLPGHGKSGGEGCDTVIGYAANLLALMDAVAVERFVAVGHSMGGAVAQMLALDAPQRVAGLALVSTGARLRVAPQILDNLPGNLDAVADFVNTYAYGPSAGDDLRRVGRRALKEIRRSWRSATTRPATCST